MLSYLTSRPLSGVTRKLKLTTLSRGFTSLKEADVSAKAELETNNGRVSDMKPHLEAEQSPELQTRGWSERIANIQQNSRLPRNVQAIYLRPLRKKAEYGLPVCDLQLRSYSVRNLEFFADFATRAAYYLKLPLSGPVPLPRIVERWTFPRSHFVHKKTQENFERITLRRLIQIKDGNLEAVQAWLAFLRKHSFYGVGMKANIWEYESLDVAESMDKALPGIEQSLGSQFTQFGQRKDAKLDTSIFNTLESERFSQSHSPLATTREG